MSKHLVYRAIYFYNSRQYNKRNNENLLKSFTNTISINKSLIFLAFLLLSVAGSLQNSFFVLAPVLYLISLSLAYSISGRISDPMVNVMFNWVVKWSLFVIFLYLTALYIKNAFVFAMFSYILINTILNPMTFILKNKALR